MTREHTYQLPINVIIEMMKGLHEQVALRASVPALPGILKQECVADIVVDENGLQSCVMRDRRTDERLFQGGEALSMVQRCGTLAWTLLPSEAAHTLIRPPPKLVESSTDHARVIPFRRVELTPVQLLTLSHAQKKVFALVNGRNAIDVIAHLLNRSPQEVYQVLLELKQKNIIDV